MKSKPYFCLLCLVMLLAASAGRAWANTAANTQIINQAQLSYNDGSGTKTATAGVTVTVSLVPSPVTVEVGSAQSTSYNGAGTTLTDSYTLTATANGPDTYTLGSAVTGSTNTSAPTATATGATATLGATVTALGSTTTVIVVPSDGVSDGKVNGIGAGDTVKIGSDVRTVQSVTDNATGTSTIVLSSPLTSAPGSGVVVGQQKVVTVSVTAGTIGSGGTDVQVSANLTVTSQTVPNPAVASATAIINTYTSGVATLAKYVRNVTTASGSGSPVNYNSVSYYLSGVTAKPGDTLEYLLVATNSSTTAAVSASVITDLLPVDYVTMKTGVYGGANKDVTYVNETGTASQLSAAADADAATYNATFDTTQNAAKGKLTVNVGQGATNLTGGSIPASSNVKVLYQVTVKP